MKTARKRKQAPAPAPAPATTDFGAGVLPEPRQFTSGEVEKSLLRVLEAPVRAKRGQVFTFAQWTLYGHGIVIVLESGQEFWLTIAQAAS